MERVRGGGGGGGEKEESIVGESHCCTKWDGKAQYVPADGSGGKVKNISKLMPSKGNVGG